MNRNAQQEAERVDKDMPLAPGDFLPRIIALRVKRSPPFGAPLALWLSMMAAVGLASRPSCSRTATYRTGWIRSSVASPFHRIRYQSPVLLGCKSLGRAFH